MHWYSWSLGVKNVVLRVIWYKTSFCKFTTGNPGRLWSSPFSILLMKSRQLGGNQIANWPQTHVWQCVPDHQFKHTRYLLTVLTLVMHWISFSSLEITEMCYIYYILFCQSKCTCNCCLCISISNNSRENPLTFSYISQWLSLLYTNTSNAFLTILVLVISVCCLSKSSSAVCFHIVPVQFLFPFACLHPFLFSTPLTLPLNTERRKRRRRKERGRRRRMRRMRTRQMMKVIQSLRPLDRALTGILGQLWFPKRDTFSPFSSCCISPVFPPFESMNISSFPLDFFVILVWLLL